MPNYKQCRFCSEKYVPLRDEIICPKCSGAVVYAVQMPVGEAIVIADMSDETAKEIRDVLIKENWIAPDSTIKPEPVEPFLEKGGIISDEFAKIIEPKQEQMIPIEVVPKSITEEKVEEIAKDIEKIIEIVEASPKDLQKEKDLEVMEEAVVELDKGENAEIIGPSAPKPDVPEEKPDAPS